MDLMDLLVIKEIQIIMAKRSMLKVDCNATCRKWVEKRCIEMGTNV